MQTYFDVGFGNDTGVSLLGESMGMFGNRRRWSDFELATLSYGYGLSVTTLQLARAYTAIASGGMLRPLTIFRQESPLPAEQVFSPDNTRAVIRMMERVVSEERQKKHKCRVIVSPAKPEPREKATATGGYGDEYVALFAGMAPASDPEVVVVVTINEPGTDDYYGGTAAAPVFASIVGQTMRLLNIAPDNLHNEPMKGRQCGRACAMMLQHLLHMVHQPLPDVEIWHKTGQQTGRQWRFVCCCAWLLNRWPTIYSPGAGQWRQCGIGRGGKPNG